MNTYTDTDRSEAAEIRETYATHEGLGRDIIRSPGKFEGEPIYVPFYWALVLEGGADEDEDGVATFRLTAEDHALWPELPVGAVTLRLQEGDDGFVLSETETEQERSHREYQAAVESGLEGMDAVSTGTCPGCEECAEGLGYESVEALSEAWECGDVESEPHFSWHPCGICGSSLGGDRESWHWVDAEGAIRHESGACVDCVLYLANGDLPESWGA